MHSNPFLPKKGGPTVAGSVGDVQSLNMYAYSRNDPINAHDPQGRNLCYGWWYTWSLYYGSELLFSVSWFVTSYCDSSGDGGAAGASGSGQSVVRKNLPPVTGKDRKTTTDAITSASNLTQKTDCDQALEPWGIPSLAALISQLQMGDIDGNDMPSGNIFDGRQSQYEVTDVDGTKTTVRQYFKKHPNAVAFETDLVDGLIFLGPRFFSESDYDRAITLIHESIHRAGLRDTDFGATQDEGSQNLTAWLKDNCH